MMLFILNIIHHLLRGVTNVVELLNIAINYFLTICYSYIRLPFLCFNLIEFDATFCPLLTSNYTSFHVLFDA